MGDIATNGKVRTLQSAAARLHQLRLDRKLTQQDVAIATGRSVTTVRNWESGRREPQPDDLPALRRVLGWTPPDMTGAMASANAVLLGGTLSLIDAIVSQVDDEPLTRADLDRAERQIADWLADPVPAEPILIESARAALGVIDLHRRGRNAQFLVLTVWWQTELQRAYFLDRTGSDPYPDERAATELVLARMLRDLRRPSRS